MYIPAGFGTMFPYIFASNAKEYIGFLKTAFGAEEIGRTEGPDGRVANCRIRIGSTSFMVSEANDKIRPTYGTFYLYVSNANIVFKKALDAGCTKMFDPIDMPYGDRQGGVIDPQGNVWWISERTNQQPYDQ